MNLFPDIKLAKEIIMFGDARIENHKFPPHKWTISIVDVNIHKTIVSKKVSLGFLFKYFIVL